MKPPREPKKEDCCNSGCTPCIFDVYQKQLKLYESFAKSGKDPKKPKENALSQLEYTKFHMIKNVAVCEQHKLLLFKQCDSASQKEVFWNVGEHILVKYNISEEQCCTRAYTPLKDIQDEKEDYDFAIIVKRYENGLVSNYLCDLTVDDKTLWRGPYGQFQLDSNKFTRIVMFAQGTGIAPFYSIIKHILDDEDNITRLSLLYCCKCINTILLREELYSFKSYWNFNYSIYLCDNTSDSNTHSLKYQEPILNQRLSTEIIPDLKNSTNKDLFLLCGSNEFMNFYKKYLEQENITNIVIF